MLLRFVTCLLLSGFSLAAAAQADTTVRIFGLPLAFFTPDTRWGGGAAGIITFRGTPLRSSISFSMAYTQRKQFLMWFPYQLYDRYGRWRCYGELGYYRYFYQYFGIGNRYPFDYLETYTARYPRVRINALWQIKPTQGLGVRYWMDALRMLDQTAGGEIERAAITGARGGTLSAIGPVWLYDTRDNQFYPRKGYFIETALSVQHRLTGSDFEVLSFSADAVRYWHLSKRQVLATEILLQMTAGHPPFFGMPQMGGSRWLRGYPAGRFRDRGLVLLQSEWRFPLFWRLKGAAFAGGGSVFGTPGEGLRWRPNGGGGLRFEFDRKQHIHIRADYGFGDGISGFYLTVGEAF